jgi:hypothetical protein
MEANAELDFLMSLFQELGSDFLGYFDCDILSVILSRKSLVVSSEDSLCNSLRLDVRAVTNSFGCSDSSSSTIFPVIRCGHLFTSQWGSMADIPSVDCPQFRGPHSEFD